jgi:6-phosphogluconate dehydrogenase
MKYMKIRCIGLGKMGSNLAYNLKDHGYDVIGYDTNKSFVDDLSKDFKTTTSLDVLFENREERVVLWMLIPNQIVDKVIEDLLPYLKDHDIIIDAGNSNYNYSIKRFHYLKSNRIDFIDLGTSGGMHGARHGMCLMAGGEDEPIAYVSKIFTDVSEPGGYAHVGKPGAGHYVKMVHNGIEYGMMQAIAEGLDLLEQSPFEFDYNQITDMWNHGSIIESNLLKHTKDAFDEDFKLSEIEGKVDDSGEGMWMIEEALKLKVSLPIITQSLFNRYKSKDDLRFQEKVIAAMRKEFGGHAVYRKK